MGRAPCCSKVGLHRGPWTPREDTLLTKYIQAHGEGHWRSLPKKAGLLRCGKSCRLRWMNYLRPDIKRGNITPDEDDLIIRMHSLLGNRWSLIAGRLPGRTDNEIKNYWNTHLSKRLRSQGTDPNTHKKLPDPPRKEPNSNNTKKRKNGNAAAATNKKQKSKGKLVEPEKPKVHLPKPVRFTSLSLPRNESFNTINSMSSSQGGDGSGIGGGCLGGEVGVEVPWSSIDNFRDYVNDNDIIDGVSFLVGGAVDDHDLVNGSDLECHHSIIPTTNNNLEKLYEEYWQLLKTTDDNEQGQLLDSFAESLLL